MSVCHGDNGTDTVFMECHQPGCHYRISHRLRCGDSLPPYVQERWHKRMAAHVRREHMRPPSAVPPTEDGGA